ncbi:MAG: prohibitin family protein [Bacteroidota bacterium]
MDKLPKIAIPVVVLIIIVIIILSKTAVNIKSGEAGVLFERFGGGVVVDEPPMGEGFHIVAPWNDVFVYEVRQQSLEENMKVLSSNGLDIRIDASIWFRPDVDNLGNLHQDKGENYIQRVLQPAISSAARTVIGRYTPEQLYASKRETIQTEIFEETEASLENQYVDVVRVLVKDVSLPGTIKDAIERKLRQEQEALEYEYRLTKAVQEAERQRIDAEGKARANEILNASLTKNILKEKGIQATVELSKSNNSKVIVIGSGEEGMPIILGGDN